MSAAAQPPHIPWPITRISPTSSWRDRKLEGCRNAVEAAACLVRGCKRGDVARDEYFTGAGIEDFGGIAPAIGAGEDHHLRALALGELGPALALNGPVVLAKTAISLDQFGHVGHANR